MKTKKMLLGLVLLAAVNIGVALPLKPIVSHYECKYGECSFIKKNGEQCGNCAQKGSIYCWSHNH